MSISDLYTLKNLSDFIKTEKVEICYLDYYSLSFFLINLETVFNIKRTAIKLIVEAR